MDQDKVAKLYGELRRESLVRKMLKVNKFSYILTVWVFLENYKTSCVCVIKKKNFF